MPLEMEDGISDAAQDFLHHCLLFDIEVNERGTIYSVGAVLQGRTWQIIPGAPRGRRQLDELDVFAEGAKFLLGHNILSHDIPRLQAAAPSLRIWRKPAIDTLYLSPLAFPANPYHRLVKDYHIVRDSINDPAQDPMRRFCTGAFFTGMPNSRGLRRPCRPWAFRCCRAMISLRPFAGSPGGMPVSLRWSG